jgi:hypothetical protein
MRWGGLALAVGGSLGALITWQEVKGKSITRPDFEEARLKNDLSWAAVLLGSGSFTASYFLEPKLAPSQLGNSPRWSVAAGPGQVGVKVRFQ